ELGEVGGPAALDVVEEDHRRPAALPAALLLDLPVLLGRVEPVVVRLELLTDKVALALDGFAPARIDAKKVVDPAAYFSHERIVGRDVARMRRAESGAVIDFEPGARPRRRVDHLDHPPAFVGRHEVAESEDLGLVLRYPID